jgi:hypothetical protein
LAIDHLAAAIRADPLHPSPYYVIGVSYHQLQQIAPAMLAYLSFLQREHNTERALNAARGIFDLTFSRIQDESDDDRNTIFIDPETDSASGDTLGLTIALSLLARTSAPEGTIAEPVADTLADLVESFIGIVADYGTDEGSESLVSTHLIPGVSAVETAGMSEAFARYVVHTARVKGSNEWIEQHPEAIDELADYFFRIAENAAD